MAKTTKRDAAAASHGSVDDRLARLLETPALARVVPHLPPETLHQLIRARGLDACTALVTSATPAQIAALLDLDLWRHASPGRDEQFDVDRFGEWLEVLVDADSAAAARIVAGVSQDVVIAGLSRYVRVLDPGIFEPVAHSDDEPGSRHEAMREGGDGVECELGGYIIRARRTDGWDAIITLLTTLESEHGDCFHTLMEGCRRHSNSMPESDGLDDLLLAAEQQLHDVAIERERRRSQHGYATPGDARAFLKMARQPICRSSGATISGSLTPNPIVAAYFRATDVPMEPSSEDVRSLGRASELPSALMPTTDGAASLDTVFELLAEAGVMPGQPRALLDSTDPSSQSAGLPRLRELMRYVRDTDVDAFLGRSRELAFLANTLLAGCSVQSRAFTPQEASDAAQSICNLGLEYWPNGTAPLETKPSRSWLIDHDLVAAFEVGWSVLHRDVSLFVADQLIATLRTIHCVDHDIQRGLVALQRALMAQRAAGTPWHARAAADVLSMLDMTAWASVVGLLDECPIVPAAMRAVLDGRTTTVSPTAFEFISTASQIADVRRFMARVPVLLAG